MADLSRNPADSVIKRKPTNDNPMGLYHYESVTLPCQWELLSGEWATAKQASITLTKINDVVHFSCSMFENLESGAISETVCVCSVSVPKRFRPKVTMDEYMQNTSNIFSQHLVPVTQGARGEVGELSITSNPALPDDDPSQGNIVISMVNPSAISGITDKDFLINKFTVSYQTSSFLNE